MGPGHLGTCVSHGKENDGSTKPKERRDFYRRELLPSGEDVSLLDRNPIWMTPCSLREVLAYRQVTRNDSRGGIRAYGNLA